METNKSKVEKEMTLVDLVKELRSSGRTIKLAVEARTKNIINEDGTVTVNKFQVLNAIDVTDDPEEKNGPTVWGSLIADNLKAPFLETESEEETCLKTQANIRKANPRVLYYGKRENGKDAWLVVGTVRAFMDI